MSKSKLSLEKQIQRFIKSGFDRRHFTDELYEMLYIQTNRFIAHFDKDGFYKTRFESGADETIKQLNAVSKTELKPLCRMLADGMVKNIHARTETKSYISCVAGGAQ